MSKQEKLSLQHPHAAGIDLGSRHHFVAVGKDKTEQPVRVFNTYTESLKEMAIWLTQLGIKTVAMEATGVYWLAVYDILEEAGLEVYLVNARHVKNVPGRKSDVQDCQWIQQLHSFGLLRASFIPTDKLRQLRAYVRQRETMEKGKTKAIMHISKALSLMNLKLHNLVSNLAGATAMKIIRDIAAGNHDPKDLVKHRHVNMKASEEQIIQSLQGNYREEYLFTLQQAIECFDFFEKQMIQCDLEVEKLLQVLTSEQSQTSLNGPDTKQIKTKKRTKKARRNQYNFPLKPYLTQIFGVDLTQIDGIEATTALEILAECGHDFSKWPTAKHFTSWLGLAPCPRISGGKILSHQVNKTNQRANLALRRAAHSLHGSKSALGAQFRKLKARKGPKVATKAMARKIAVIIYQMVRNQQPFTKTSDKEFEKAYQHHLWKKLNRQAKRLGYSLYPENTNPSLSGP